MFGSLLGALTNFLQNSGTVLSSATDLKLVANFSNNKLVSSSDGYFTPVMFSMS